MFSKSRDARMGSSFLGIIPCQRPERQWCFSICIDGNLSVRVRAAEQRPRSGATVSSLARKKGSVNALSFVKGLLQIHV